MKTDLTQWMRARLDHVLTLDRDFDRVTATALARSVAKRWSMPGRAWSTLGLNTFDPTPEEQYVGNFRRGRIFRKQPEDMRDKWEYDLDAAGRVLRARCHCSEWLPCWGYEDNIMVPSAAENELTYVHYSLREGMEPWSEYFFVFCFDADGRLERRLTGVLRDGVPPTADAQSFHWEGTRLLRVEEHIMPAEEPSDDDLAALRNLFSLHI